MDTIRIQEATARDLAAIVDLLVDGKVNAATHVPESYRTAFEAITADANNQLLVAKLDDEVVGTIQLTFIPGLSYKGGVRMHVEGVVVSSEHRNRGIGTQLMEYAIAAARQKGCCVVQLMTPKQRTQAQRFYVRLGFALTHEGAKLEL